MKVQCIKCKQDKELEEFSKNPSKLLGINKVCKICHSEYRKEYYKKNRIKEISQVKQYQSTYPPKPISAKSFSWKAGRTIKKECPICRNEVYLTKVEDKINKIRYCSKECRATQNKSYYHHYLYDVKRRSVKMKKDFDLTEEFIRDLLEIKQRNKCNILGTDIKLYCHKSEKCLCNSASLDRIDSSKGYTKDNVQWICLGINYMKLDYGEDNMHELLKLIKENYIPVPKAAVVSTLQKCDL